MNKSLCLACDKEFTYEEERKDFFSSRSYFFPPRYCSECFASNLEKIWEVPGKKKIITCCVCGAEQKVNFIPSEDKPVFCRECFEAQKG